MLVARGLDGEPEIRLKLKREFVGAEHSSWNRLDLTYIPVQLS